MLGYTIRPRKIWRTAMTLAAALWIAIGLLAATTGQLRWNDAAMALLWLLMAAYISTVATMVDGDGMTVMAFGRLIRRVAWKDVQSGKLRGVGNVWQLKFKVAGRSTPVNLRYPLGGGAQAGTKVRVPGLEALDFVLDRLPEDALIDDVRPVTPPGA